MKAANKLNKTKAKLKKTRAKIRRGKAAKNPKNKASVRKKTFNY